MSEQTPVLPELEHEREKQAEAGWASNLDCERGAG